MVSAGRILKRSRESAGLTQAALGERLGLGQSAIAKLESPRANPSIETLDRALRATGHRLVVDRVPWAPSVDESLIRRHLERPPAERLRSIEVTYREARKLARAGERSRGELG